MIKINKLRLRNLDNYSFNILFCFCFFFINIIASPVDNSSFLETLWLVDKHFAKEKTLNTYCWCQQVYSP